MMTAANLPRQHPTPSPILPRPQLLDPTAAAPVPGIARPRPSNNEIHTSSSSNYYCCALYRKCLLLP